MNTEHGSRHHPQPLNKFGRGYADMIDRAIILKILNQHVQTMAQLDRYMRGELPTCPMQNEVNCALGRWYHTAHTCDPILRERPAFRRLGTEHRRFHELTAVAVALYHDGEVAMASRTLTQAYNVHNRILQLLLALDRDINPMASVD